MVAPARGLTGGDGEQAVGRWRRKRWEVAGPRGYCEQQGRETNRVEEGGILGAPLADGTTSIRRRSMTSVALLGNSGSHGGAVETVGGWHHKSTMSTHSRYITQ